MPGMLRRCAQILGLVNHKDKKTRRKKEIGGASVTLDMTSQSKDIFVRVVHAGGREELYQNAISVSHLLEKYPGMCVARPQVFKDSCEAFLWPDEKLLPGQKYYMIPSTTAQKLKRNHQKKGKVKRIAESKEDNSDAKITWEAAGNESDVSVRSAKEYFISKERERRSGFVKRRGIRAKKPFVPPLPKGRTTHGYGWEPSLTSVQELSP